MIEIKGKKPVAKPIGAVVEAAAGVSVGKAN